MTARRSSVVPFAVCAAYSCGLVWLALLPRVEVGVSDVDAHAVAYGVHAMLLYWALRSFASPLGAPLGALLGTGAFGASTELLQLLQPSRSAEVKDLVSDLAGAAVAVIGIVAARRALGLARRAVPRGRLDDGSGGERGRAAADRGEDAMVTGSRVEESGGANVQATCIHCYEPMRAGARRCPSCLSWQSRWAADSQNPRVELALLVGGVAVLAALFTWLHVLGAGTPKAPVPDPSPEVQVVDVNPQPCRDGALAVLGTLRNRSAIAWRDPVLQVRCFGRDGQPVDTFATRAWAVFIPANADTPFKVVDQTPIRELSAYASCTVELRSAQRAE